MTRLLCTALVAFMALLVAPAPAAAMKDSFPGEIKLIQRLSAEERIAYFGLQYAMNKYQRKAFLSIATAGSRSDWLDRYWIDRDPSPATAENERKIEHEKRVALARKLFGMKKAP